MKINNEIELLFRTHYKVMLSLAIRYLHDEDAARDIVHDIFASLLVGDLKSVNRAFLMKAVRYACLKYIRSLSIRERFVRLYPLECDESDEDVGPDENDISRLNAIIASRLSEQTVKVLRLRFNDRLTYSEISRELAVSEVTVYKHLRHALNVLRQYFNNDER